MLYSTRLPRRETIEHGWTKRNPQSTDWEKNKMKPTNPNAHTYVNGTDVKTHGYALTHNTFLQ